MLFGKYFTMDDKRVADYFVVAGLPEELEPVDDISKDGYHLKWYHTKPPITDIAIVFSSLGETCPKDFEMIEETPTGKLKLFRPGKLNFVIF